MRGNDCGLCPLRSHAIFRTCDSREREFISRIKKGEIEVAAGTQILTEGEQSNHLYTVLSGWAFRHKGTEDGGMQILNFALPGDLVGLQSAVMGKMEHSVGALTKLKLCVFDRRDVWEIYTNHPTLAFALTWFAAREEQILDQNLVSLGQYTGLQKITHLILHLFDRAKAVGLADNDHLQVPLTQQHLGQALGLTNVHVNRLLRILAERGLIEVRGNSFRILDRAAAERLANYEEPAKEMTRPIL